VLLLVVASELDQLSDLPGWPRAKKAGDCLVDMRPVNRSRSLSATADWKRCAGVIASPLDEFGMGCRNAHGCRARQTLWNNPRSRI
jgi:hypothetical protein